MYPVSLLIQDNKYRETEALRIRKACQYFQVFILRAVINMHYNKITINHFSKRRVCRNQGIKSPAPYAPVSSYLQQYMFVLLPGLQDGIIYIVQSIRFRIIDMRIGVLLLCV